MNIRVFGGSALSSVRSRVLGVGSCPDVILLLGFATGLNYKPPGTVPAEYQPRSNSEPQPSPHPIWQELPSEDRLMSLFIMVTGIEWEVSFSSELPVQCPSCWEAVFTLALPSAFGLYPSLPVPI